MSRLTIACLAALVSLVPMGYASAQSYVPYSGRMTVTRSPSGFSRGYTYIAPSYYPAPVWTYDGFFLGFSGTSYPGYYIPRPLRMTEMPGSPFFPPPDALPDQLGSLAEPPLVSPDPALRAVVRSSAAARAKALDLQATGDQYVRQQKYHLALSIYRQALNQADDLAALHLRYGIMFAALARYDRAAMEFRRATHIDPALPISNFTLESLFGPDSQLVRASILSRITQWAGDDITDSDRLYILGVLLHFNQDDRAQELFNEAARLTDGAEHVVAFLPRPDQTVPPQKNKDGSGALPLPPAPLPEDGAADAPPPPGIIDRPAAPKAKSVPAAPAKSSDDVSRVDGPILLPPSPK